MTDALFKLRRRIAIHAQQPVALTLRRLRTKLLWETEHFYRYDADKEIDDRVVAVDLDTAIAALARISNLDDDEAEAYREAARKERKQPYCLYVEDEVAHVSWLQPAQAEDLVPWLGLADRQVWTINNCITDPAFRGRGLYPACIRTIASSMNTTDEVLIYTHDWNVASQRGIEKAGFDRVATRTTYKIPGTHHTIWNTKAAA